VIEPDLHDLNRSEILRGPQGTLFGSGSMGGTVRLISNPAELDGISIERSERLIGHGRRRLQPQRQLDGQSPAYKRHFGITGVCEIKPQDFRSLLGQGLYPSLLGFNRATESFSHFTVEIIATHYTHSRRRRRVSR
jgi:hypothetical protein